MEISHSPAPVITLTTLILSNRLSVTPDSFLCISTVSDITVLREFQLGFLVHAGFNS